MKASYKEFLKVNRSALTSAIDFKADKFLDDLESKKVITSIQREQTLRGDAVSHEQVGRLLDFMEKRTDEQFEEFCRILNQSAGQSDAHKILKNMDQNDYQYIFGTSAVRVSHKVAVAESGFEQVIIKTTTFLLKKLNCEGRLLAMLREAEVIGDTELDRITNAGNAHDDKVNELLKTMRKKDNKAFLLFIRCLKEDGQTPVAEQLIRQLPEADQDEFRPSKEAVPATSEASLTHKADRDEYNNTSDIPDAGNEVACEVKMSTEEFYLSTYTEDEVYDMKGKKKGEALIINIKEFESEDLTTRTGTEVDKERLDKLWKQLGFAVTVSENPTAQDMMDEIQHFGQRPAQKNAKCVVICILTHGCNEMVYGSDGKPVLIGHLLGLLDNRRCPNLRNKPKLWFFQACRGSLTDSGVKCGDPAGDTVADTSKVESTSINKKFPWWQGHGFKGVKDEVSTSDEEADDPAIQDPTLSDYFIAYPTPAGYLSWRNKMTGSWFIQAIVEVFQKHAANQDICAMMNEVNSVVSKRTTPKFGLSGRMTLKSQMSEYVCRLRKMHLYFYPGV